MENVTTEKNNELKFLSLQEESSKGYQDPKGQDNSLNTIPKNQNQYENT